MAEEQRRTISTRVPVPDDETEDLLDEQFRADIAEVEAWNRAAREAREMIERRRREAEGE